MAHLQKIIVSLFFSSLVVAAQVNLAAASSSAQTSSSKPLKVAVLDFRGDGIKPDEALALTDRFRADLVRSERFTILERSQMDAILKEQGFQQSGATCSNDECAVKMGQMLGVDKLVTGSIGKLGKAFMVNARLVDVQTGKIDKAASEDCNCDIEDLIPLVTRLAKALAEQVGAPPKSAPTAAQSAPSNPGAGGSLLDQLRKATNRGKLETH